MARRSLRGEMRPCHDLLPEPRTPVDTVVTGSGVPV